MPSVTEGSSKSDSRLLLISNRLPITIKRSDDGGYDFSMSSGGLVSGLSGLSRSTTFQWYGWPGLEVPEKEAGPLTARLKDEYNAVPIYIDDELADRHYNGFSSTMGLSFAPLGCADASQTKFSGLYSTTTLAKSPSTSLLGTPTRKPTASLLKLLPRMSRTVTSSGSTTTT